MSPFGICHVPKPIFGIVASVFSVYASVNIFISYYSKYFIAVPRLAYVNLVQDCL